MLNGFLKKVGGHGERYIIIAELKHGRGRGVRAWG